MVAVGKISIDMVAYTGKLLKPMKQAQKSVTDFTKHVSGMAGALKKLILPLAGIAAGAITAGAAFAVVRKQFGEIDEIAKEADRLGIATEQLTAMQHAADLAGVSTEELTTALQFMLRQGKNVSDLGAIADEMAAMSDPAERMQLAVKMFGRGGAGMINVLQGGAESLRNIVKDATLLGLTFSRLDAGKVEEANDAITRMKAGIAGMGRMAAIALSPMVTDIVNWVTEIEIAVIGFTDNWKKNWDAIKEWTPGFFDALTKNIENNWAVMVGNLVTDFIEGLKLIGKAMPLITQTLGKEMTSGGTMEWITRGLLLPFGGEIWRANEQLNPSEGPDEKLKKMLKEGLAKLTGPTANTSWVWPEPPKLDLERKPPEPDLLQGSARPNWLGVFKDVAKAFAPPRTIDLGIDRLLDAFRQQPQWEDIRVGAAERGSQEAFSAIMNTQKKIEEQHFEEAKRQTGLLQSIAATKITLAITSFIHP